MRTRLSIPGAISSRAVMLGVAAMLALAAPAQTARSADVPVRTKICVSILPQQYFVERVGGAHVDVTVLVGPGQSPHTYEPTPKQVAGLSEAKVYFTIGLAFENALVEKTKAAFPDVRIIDTRKGITLRTVTDREAAAEKSGAHAGGSNGDAGSHGAGEPDPHIWLAPRLVKTQARTICDALKQVDPSNSADYEANLAAFDADLDAVDKRIAAAFAPLPEREFFVYHPAFGYFADAYGLKQTAIEIEGKEPTAKQLAALIDHAKREKVRIIFVEPQSSAKSANAVAEAIGGAVVVSIDPLARDYLANLEGLAALVKKALAPEVSGQGATKGKS